MAKKITSLNTIKKRLKKALEEQHSYSEGLDTLIETTAISIQSLYEISSERLLMSQPTLVEKSREGNERTVANPLYKMQIEYIEQVRKQLRELRLTLDTVTGVDGDELDDMYKEIESIKE